MPYAGDRCLLCDCVGNVISPQDMPSQQGTSCLYLRDARTHATYALTCRPCLPQSELAVTACTLTARTFRLLMAIACYFDLNAKQYDFIRAFCNARLDEVVYCRLPDGFRQAGELWLLLRALYELRRSPLLWYKELAAFLRA